MANPWDNDPVAPVVSADKPAWANDPVAVHVHRGGRTGGDSGAVRPDDSALAVGNAFGMSGPLGATNDRNGPDPDAHPIRDALDTAAAAAASIPGAIAKGVTDIPAAITTGLSKAEFGDAGPSYGNALAPAIDAVTPSPHTSYGKAAADALNSTARDAAATVNSIPGVAPITHALAPAGRVIGDVAAAAPIIGKAGAVADAASAANADAAAARAAVTPGDANVAERLKAGGFHMSPTSEARLPAVNGAGGENAGSIARGTEALVGSTNLGAQNISRNMPVIQHWATSEIGAPDGPITPEVIANAKEAPAATYQRVADATSEAKPVSEETARALAATAEPNVLGNTPSRKHGASMEVLSGQPMTGQQLMDAMSQLRQDGYARLSAQPGVQVKPGARAFGEAQLDAANALEQELNNRVAQTGNSQLLGDYQAARVRFAKIGTVERSLDGFNVDPFKIEAMGDRSGALTGGLQLIADSAKHIPSDVGARVPSIGITRADVGGAAAGGAAGAVIAAATGHPGLALVGAGAPAAQAGIRKILGATRGQAALSELPSSAAEVAPGSPLGHYFDNPAPPEPSFDLTHPPGPAFEPGHQADAFHPTPELANAPVAGMTRAESTQHPRPGLTLGRPDETAFEAHPPSPGAPGVAAEPNTLPAPAATGEPIGPSPANPGARPVGGTPTAPQHQLPLGDVPNPDMVDFYHGGPRQLSAFSDEHIGTGEGNQSFSHGHYVGEAKPVGLHYVPDTGGYLTHGQVPKATVDKMLDLDKPIKDQPAVLEALNIDKDAKPKLNGIDPNWTGRELHDKLVAGATNVGPRIGANVAETKPIVSKWLADQGISGARYHDSVSRAAGKGTRNMVIYDPKQAKILSSTKVAPKLGDNFGGRPTVGGDLTADDLKLAE